MSQSKRQPSGDKHIWRYDVNFETRPKWNPILISHMEWHLVLVIKHVALSLGTVVCCQPAEGQYELPGMIRRITKDDHCK